MMSRLCVLLCVALDCSLWSCMLNCSFHYLLVLKIVRKLNSDISSSNGDHIDTNGNSHDSTSDPKRRRVTEKEFTHTPFVSTIRESCALKIEGFRRPLHQKVGNKGNNQSG